MAIIKIDDDGFARPIHEVAYAFVREQSAGEWTDEIIARDAAKLEELIRKCIRVQLPHLSESNRNLYVEYTG